MPESGKSEGPQLMRRHKTEKVVTLASGERANVVTEGSKKDGYVQHIETNDRMDANVMPRTVHYRFRKE